MAGDTPDKSPRGTSFLTDLRGWIETVGGARSSGVRPSAASALRPFLPNAIERVRDGLARGHVHVDEAERVADVAQLRRDGSTDRDSIAVRQGNPEPDWLIRFHLGWRIHETAAEAEVVDPEMELEETQPDGVERSGHPRIGAPIPDIWRAGGSSWTTGALIAMHGHRLVQCNVPTSPDGPVKRRGEERSKGLRGTQRRGQAR
jgi:hypothetical protein